MQAVLRVGSRLVGGLWACTSRGKPWDNARAWPNTEKFRAQLPAEALAKVPEFDHESEDCDSAD